MMRFLLSLLLLLQGTTTAGPTLTGGPTLRTQGAGTGTFTLVQSGFNDSCASVTTCNITLGASLTTGNAYEFCATSTIVAGFGISSVSAGGTLLQAYSTQSTTGGFMGACAYVLPSSSSGGASPITITFPVTSGTTCYVWLAELHPSANGANVGLDNDGVGFQSSVSSAVGGPFTLSGTNDGIAQSYVGAASFAKASVVTAPYAANVHWAAGPPSFSAFTVAVNPGSGTWPTWTMSGSDSPTTSALALGWNVTACKDDGFYDFEGGISGNTVVAATLNSSGHGWLGGLWSLVGTTIWQTGASMPLLNASPRLCGDGVTYSSGAGTLGLRQTGNGASVANNITLTSVPSGGALGIKTFSESINFKSSLTAADVTNMDVFYVKASGGAVNWMWHGNGTNRFMQLECNDTSTTSAQTITISSNTEYTLMILFDSAGGTHKGRVYDTSGTQIGSEATCSASAGNLVQGVVIGNVGAQVMTNGATNDFDSLKFDGAGTWPLTQ